MERNQSGHDAATSAPERTDDKKDKKTGVTGARKQQAETRIARSLDELFNRERAQTEKTPAKVGRPVERPQENSKRGAEAVATETERTAADGAEHTPNDNEIAELATLDDEETRYVQQAVAREHLVTLEDADETVQQQLRVTTDFLERVADGEDLDSAVAAVAAEHGLDETDLTSEEIELAPEHVAADSASADDETARFHAPAPAQRPMAGGSGARPAAAPGGPMPGSQPAGPVETWGSNGQEPSAKTPGETALVNTADYYRRRAVGNLLVGGIVGYLIGRRRGRIKTEKRLLPVQQRLQRRVQTLEQTITQKEQQLTAAVAAKERAATSVQHSEQVATVRTERMQPGRQESRVGMRKPAEQLGHMIVERTRIERPANIRAAFRPEEVKMLDRTQMLELSEKVVVEGASLRSMYESNLIGERQLRHLLSEHLRGKDIRSELQRHVVEREIDFERDPVLRDRVREKLQASRNADNTSTGGSGGMLADLLAGAGLVDDEQTGSSQPTGEPNHNGAHNSRVSQQRRVADGAMVTAIIVLAIVVIALLMR